MVDLCAFMVWVSDGVLTPSGSEFELEEDGGGNDSDRCPNLMSEVTGSQRRIKGLPKPTWEAITQACHNFNYPPTSAIADKHAREAVSDEQSVPG